MGGKTNKGASLYRDFPTFAFSGRIHFFLRKVEKRANPRVSSRYGGNAKVVHFLGKTKPWNFTYDPKAKQIGGSVHEATTHPTFLLDWWSLYSSEVVPMLQEQYGDQPFHSGCVEVSGAAVQLDRTVWEDLKYCPPLRLLPIFPKRILTLYSLHDSMVSIHK